MRQPPFFFFFRYFDARFASRRDEPLRIECRADYATPYASPADMRADACR